MSSRELLKTNLSLLEEIDALGAAIGTEVVPIQFMNMMNFLSNEKSSLQTSNDRAFRIFLL